MLAKVLLRPPNFSVPCILAVSSNTIIDAEYTTREREAEMRDSLFEKKNKRESSQRRRRSGCSWLRAVSQDIAKTIEPEHVLGG